MKTIKINGVNYEQITEFKGKSPCAQCDLKKQCDIDELTVNFCSALIGDESYWKKVNVRKKVGINEKESKN